MLIKQQRVQNGMEPILQWESPISYLWGSSVHPQNLCCPFVVPITGMGSLLCCWLGTEWGEWRTRCFWAICKRLLQLELPSWLPSTSSHPCSREHNWAKRQQARWAPGGSVIPTSKLSILVWSWAELWLSLAPGCSQALCIPLEFHIFALPESWACWGTDQSEILHIRSEYNS